MLLHGCIWLCFACVAFGPCVRHDVLAHDLYLCALLAAALFGLLKSSLAFLLNGFYPCQGALPVGQGCRAQSQPPGYSKPGSAGLLSSLDVGAYRSPGCLVLLHGRESAGAGPRVR